MGSARKCGCPSAQPLPQAVFRAGMACIEQMMAEAALSATPQAPAGIRECWKQSMRYKRLQSLWQKLHEADDNISSSQKILRRMGRWLPF